MPSRVRADLYAESFGWRREYGGGAASDLVPTVRARLLLQPWLGLGLQAYVFTQATRDLASRAHGDLGLPVIYADDRLLAGAGVMLRFWRRRLGALAQAGPAVALVDDRTAPVLLDARAGLFGSLESAGCRPAPASGARFGLTPCADLYGESFYLSRFRHNVVGALRGRLAAGHLATGPVLWQLVLEARGAADRNHDYYNNFADAGLGQRWRLLGALPIDLLVGIHAGGYLGVSGRDPLPAEPRYVDARVQAATYLEF